jgi:hypothetical protein
MFPDSDCRSSRRRRAWARAKVASAFVDVRDV